MANIPLWQHFLYAAIATIGFSIFFNVPSKLLVYEGIVGGIGWLAYLLGLKYIESATLYSFVAAAVVSVCAEILARKLKQPAIIIVIPGILPLVPGIGLYNTVYYIMEKQYDMAAATGSKAVMVTIGIALGIVVISSMSKVFNLYQLKKAFTNNDALKYVNWVNIGKNRTNSRFIIDREAMKKQLNSLNSEVTPDDIKSINNDAFDTYDGIYEYYTSKISNKDDLSDVDSNNILDNIDFDVVERFVDATIDKEEKKTKKKAEKDKKESGENNK